MDDFGVLVKNYGIKPQGKSVPMAASKTGTRTHNYNNSANLDQPFGSKEFSKSTQSSSSVIGSFLDQNDIFGFSSSQNPQNYASPDVFDDVFRMPAKNSSFSNGGGAGFDFDMESMFAGSVNLDAKSSDVNDDLIWDFPGKKSSNKVAESNDLLSSDPVDDFLGNLANLGSNPGKRSDVIKENNVNNDDLIPGFGRTIAKNDRAQASSTQKSAGFSYLDEFEDFATGKTKKNVNGKLDAFTINNELKKTSKHKSQDTNFFDVEGSLDVDSVHKKEVERESGNMFQTEATDLDSFFSVHTRKSVPVSENKSMGGKTEEVPDLFFGTTFRKEKKIPPTIFSDDFSSIFGGPPSSGQFEEVEGESEDRRRARFERYQRTETRMARALADMNQREFEAQQEQEERHRIAEAMDVEMKRWAAGKEGNLRALLSSLQQVLGPEFCWRSVTLTDLITSSQVKIAYKKAALCVHPDKVQQKGASLQQKFVAEKVFDLLKEAWNKFNSEELR